MTKVRQAAPPVPAFLVPTVLESLSKSRYASITEVVPCEADLACAYPGNCSKTDIILTGDTDLIIHKPDGRIVFFDDIDFMLQKNGQSTLSAFSYDSHDFARRIGTTDLAALAYFLSRDRFVSIEHAAKLVKSHGRSQVEATGIADFREVYNAGAFSSRNLVDTVWRENLKFVKALRFLDPRISELVFAILWYRTAKAAQPRLFLANLLEDPTRATAWCASSIIRQLGYSIICLAFEYRGGIEEVDRRGARIVSVPVQCLSMQSCKNMTKDFLGVMSSLHAEFPSEVNVAVWRTFALLRVLCWAKDNSKPVSNPARTLQIVRGEQKQLSWPDLHLNAQVEAALYSMRILRQLVTICRVWLESSAGRVKKELRELVGEMSGFLSALPMLQELMPLPGEALKVGRCAQRIQFELAEQQSREPPISDLATHTQMEASKVRRKTDKAKPTKRPKVVNGGSIDQNNIYSVLENRT